MNRTHARLVLALGMAPLILAAAWWALGQALPPASPPPAPQALRPEQVVEGVAELATRLRSGAPGATAEDWTLLARSHAALEDFTQAAQDYAQALRLQPRSAQLRADRADVLVATHTPGALAEADTLLHEALALDPLNAKALAVSGTVAWERQAWGDAAAWWTQAKAVSDPGSDFVRELDGSIAAAREKAAQAGKAVSPAKR